MRSPRIVASRRTAAERARARRGFTIVEAIIAIVMLAAGVLALVSSSAVVMREMTTGGQRTVAAAIATHRMETLRGYNLCSKLVSDTARTRGMKEAWVNEGTATGGGQQSRRIKYRITYQAGRMQRTDSMTTFIPCT